MADIFISYRSTRQPAAEFLAKTFEQLGYSTWWDFNLIAGEYFPARLQEELTNAKVIIVLWCSESIKSRYVREEAQEGYDAKKLIPIKIERIAPPIGFRSLHTHNLASWDGDIESPVFQRVLRDIAMRVGHPPTIKPGRGSLKRRSRPEGFRLLSLIPKTEPTRPEDHDFPSLRPINRREKLVVRKAMSLVYLFCRLDQIAPSGAWGKSLVRTYFAARGEKPRAYERQEGGMSSTAVVAMALHSLRTGKNSPIDTSIEKALAYFKSRWVPHQGFGSFTIVGGGPLKPHPSLRHTLAAALALLETGREADLKYAADAANLVASQLDRWLDGSDVDKCPSATAAFAFALFDQLSQPHYRYLQAGRDKLTHFLEGWKSYRVRCLGHLNQVLARSDRKPWFPPYGGLEEYLFYSSFVPWRIAPSLFLEEGAELHVCNLKAVLQEVTSFGIASAPQAATVKAKWKNADFGTTCALIGLLHEPQILRAAAIHRLTDALLTKRSLLIAALAKMMEKPQAKYFDLLCCEDACGILHLTRIAECHIPPRELLLIDLLVEAIEQNKPKRVITKIMARAKIHKALLEQIINAASFGEK